MNIASPELAKSMIYKVIYNVQEPEEAHELQKEISSASQEGAGREKAMVGPDAP